MHTQLRNELLQISSIKQNFRDLPAERRFHNTWSSVLQFEVLISKLLSIDWLTTHAISVSEVTSLDHEARNNSVEWASLVVQRFPRFPSSFLPCKWCAKWIINRLSHDQKGTYPPSAEFSLILQTWAIILMLPLQQINHTKICIQTLLECPKWFPRPTNVTYPRLCLFIWEVVQ